MSAKEGDTRTMVYQRRSCEFCPEPATKKYASLLEGTRSNPASSAYGRDDCSWCSDRDTYSCDEHHADGYKPDPGYCRAATFTFNERFKHMFLEWVAVEPVESALGEPREDIS